MYFTFSDSDIQRQKPELAEVYRVQEAWLAKLGHWGEAMDKYEARLKINPCDGDAIAGTATCLNSACSGY